MTKRLVNLAPDALLDGNSGGTGIDADELPAGLTIQSTGNPQSPWAAVPVPPPGLMVIEDEGVPLPGSPHTILDFAGAGVTATNAGGGKALVTIPGAPPPPPSQSPIQIEDEGIASGVAGQAITYNFVGAGVTAVVAGATCTISIPGAAVAIPLSEIVFGTGAGVTSSPDVTYSPVGGQFFVNTISGTGGSVAVAAPSNTGIFAADSNGAAAGGNMVLSAGFGGTTGAGGAMTVRAGNGGATSGNGGTLILDGGDVPGGATGNAGNVFIRAKASVTGAGSNAGDVFISAGASNAANPGGIISLSTGGGSTGGSISFQTGTGTVAGGPITHVAGNATALSGGTGGLIALTSGNGDGAGAGGAINIVSGNGGATANAGTIALTGGLGGTTGGEGGDVILTGGAAQAGNSEGGDVKLIAGAGNGTGSGGDVDIVAGNAGVGTGVGGGITATAGAGGNTSGNGGSATFQGGVANDGDGGAVFITGRNGNGTNRNGGDLTLTAGDRTGTGTAGKIKLVLSATGDLQINGSAGTAGQVITSRGPNLPPVWAAPFPSFNLNAAQFDNPNNSNWTVNALAPAIAPAANPALTVRAFDDTTEEGVGFNFNIPAGATSMVFRFKSRAATAPGAATTVTPRLYRRTIPDNAAVTAWSAAFAFTAIDIPTNTNYQYDSQTVTLATLGLTAGNHVQFELTRAAGGLTGDWYLLNLEISFT